MCSGCQHLALFQGPSCMLCSGKAWAQFECRPQQSDAYSCEHQAAWALQKASETPQLSPADGVAPHPWRTCRQCLRRCTVTCPGRDRHWVVSSDCSWAPSSALVWNEPCFIQWASWQRAWSSSSSSEPMRVRRLKDGEKPGMSVGNIFGKPPGDVWWTLTYAHQPTPLKLEQRHANPSCCLKQLFVFKELWEPTHDENREGETAWSLG